MRRQPNTGTPRQGRGQGQRVRETTHARLLAAAEGLFLSQGYGATTVDAVAHAAGFTTGAVYSNFAGKAGLFLAVLEQVTARELEAVRAALEQARTDEQRLHVFTTTVARDPERWRARVAATFEFLVEARHDPALLARVRAAQAPADEAVGELLAAVCDAVGIEPPAPPVQMGQELLATMNGLAVRSLFDDELDLRRALARAVNTVLTAERSGPLPQPEPTRSRRGRR